MISVAFLFIAGFAVVCANDGKYDLLSVQAKNEQRIIDFQPTLPSTRESYIGKSSQRENQFRMQSNKMDKSLIQDDKLSQITSSGFNSQEMLSTGSPMSQKLRMETEQNSFRSQEHFAPEVTASNHPAKQDNFSPHQAQFYNREQGLPNHLQFHDGRQGMPEEQTAFRNRQPEIIDQEFFDNKQASHQPEFYSGRRQAPEQQQLFNDAPTSKNQQLFSGYRQPSDKQQFNDNFQIRMKDQHIDNKRIFQDPSNQNSNMFSNKHLTPFQPDGIQGTVRLSTFDNRLQPTMFPQNPTLHSSSPINVSGMNHLPLLPVMVNSANPSATMKSVAIGKGSYHPGKASIRQHLQTPFVHYAYRHLL